jgi:hypothetical protein
MATVPTNRLERELRALYLRWLAGIEGQQDIAAYVQEFSVASEQLIADLGGQVAARGSFWGATDFPVPKTLNLSPVVNVVYNEMIQGAIQASIAAGLNPTSAARAMFRAGLDKSFNKLNRLARTETVSAYWKNQWDSTEGLPDIIMLWGSEESKRTCDYCLARDGLVVEDQRIRDHPNGRCTLVPTHRDGFRYKGTLQADGSVTMDPKWGRPRAKAPVQPDKPRAAAPGALPAANFQGGSP